MAKYVIIIISMVLVNNYPLAQFQKRRWHNLWLNM